MLILIQVPGIVGNNVGLRGLEHSRDSLDIDGTC